MAPRSGPTRLIAESALALDHRGLDWIKEKIEDGDKERRQVQDELSPRSMTRMSSPGTVMIQIEEFGRKYKEAAAAD